MRRTTSFRLLLPALALLAGACDDSSSPLAPPDLAEPTPAAGERPARQDLADLLGDRAHWADGYLVAGDPTAASYTPLVNTSFNRTGRAITITKPAATIGRYIAVFAGLSNYIGSRNTVHVTALGTVPGAETAYCKPVAATLVSDKVEVRCFKAGTGAAVNSQFTLLVTRDYPDLAFAYANQPTIASYAPAAPGSWNPAGTIKVVRSGLGQYLVTFSGLGAELPLSVGGHVQVNAVGTGGAHCQVAAWGGTPNMAVRVGCFTPAGARVDTKFTVLFLAPTEHLAYALQDQLAAMGNYGPNLLYASNPSGGGIYFTHDVTGIYRITWSDVDPEILGDGNAEVTAYGEKGEQCKVSTWNYQSVEVRCFTVKGVLTNSYFTVLLGS